jgi:hypothetical protein
MHNFPTSPLFPTLNLPFDSPREAGKAAHHSSAVLAARVEHQTNA